MVEDISLKKGTMKVYKLKKKVQRNHCKYESWIVEVDLDNNITMANQVYNYEWYTQQNFWE
jgi:hypothetical protein